MLPNAAPGAGAATVDPREMSGRTLSRIEELVADNASGDALNMLQDMVRDFAKEEMREVLQLRERHATVRRDNNRDAIIALREGILDLAYRVDAKIQQPAAPPLPGADRSEVARKEEPATSDEVRRRHFELVWKDPKSLVVDARDLVKTYKRSGYTLRPISFQLRLGEITGIVGRNASGKTTLLRMIMGELHPDGGTIDYPSLSKRRGDWREIRRQIAYVPQLPERWYGSLRQNLNFVAAAASRNGHDPTELIDACVARYELKPYEHATWDEISGGYKIRFELVRALACEPSLLILDEPLAYLDVIARQRFLKDLQTIAMSFARPIPIVVTSQHLIEVEAIANQIIFIDNGEPRYIGALAGIAEKAQNRTFEVSLLAARDDVMLALSGLALLSILPTMDGYILVFDKSSDIAVVFQRLRAAFADRLTAIRDVTSSVRSLMTEDVQ